MKKIILLFIVGFLFVISSCQKDKVNEINQLSSDTNFQKIEPKAGELLYKASQKLLQDNEIAYKQKITVNLKNFTSLNRPSACGYISDENIILSEVYRISGDCENGIVQLTYQTNFITYRNPYNMVYDFTCNLAGSVYYPQIVTLQNETQICDPLDPYGSLAPCPVRYTYSISFNVSTAIYNNSSITNNNIITTCTITNDTQTLTQSVNLDNPPSYYLTIPADVYITPTNNNHGFFAADRCTVLLCNVYHYICPTSSVFKYRIVGTSTWITIGLPSNQANVASGTYEYECYHIYPFGNSLTATGNFVIP